MLVCCYQYTQRIGMIGGARGRNRTGTTFLSRQILSLLCLPISPLGRMRLIVKKLQRNKTKTGVNATTRHLFPSKSTLYPIFRGFTRDGNFN